jgi:1-deoxy-D-xylulose-5-phosphate reductoisomerase
MKSLVILGSTGSIGQQTLDVVRSFPERFRVVGLACGKNVGLLREQVAEFRPRFASFREGVEGEAVGDARPLSPEEMVSNDEVDVVVVATSGRAGLMATLGAVGSGKTVALANKEVLVAAGEIVMEEARRHGATILPIDSEHSAVWQCLAGEQSGGIARLVLTASGGPFRLKSMAELAEVTANDALRHPTWEMGTKVTVDSATLMNKGMEIIEAHWLFDVPYSQIEVVVHPQSVVHSIVEFTDGSSKAQLSMPDMRLPIQYALAYPERWDGPFRRAIDYAGIGSLQFERADEERFPCLELARQAGELGGTYAAALSAADEVAVDLFLGRNIGFMDIPSLIRKTLDEHVSVANPSIDDVVAADSWARAVALGSVGMAR